MCACAFINFERSSLDMRLRVASRYVGEMPSSTLQSKSSHTPPRLVVPMSERQQMALLMQMTSDGQSGRINYGYIQILYLSVVALICTPASCIDNQVQIRPNCRQRCRCTPRTPLSPRIRTSLVRRSGWSDSSSQACMHRLVDDLSAIVTGQLFCCLNEPASSAW
uniref:Uncharacterized protein n=1 Tax=Timema shepardi TaxID=629360 RepID=A0A7R9G5A1_TIMSH|nr:unnamed protein product [Timema shepardi]